ncbi:radical SAM protein [Bacteroidota bacterium]
MKYIPGYLKLHKTGQLQKIVKSIEKKYSSCDICPHNCKVNRFEYKNGKCKTGYLPFIASYNAHFGEEPPLVGIFGSGTIFFSNCNLKCVFCQNCDISQMGYGKNISFEELADIMILLQKRQCHNINFVSPTHQIYAILQALKIAIEKGLSIPLVYNSGGYDSVETLKLVNGVFDIYMPDFKYMNDELSNILSDVSDYSQNTKRAINEMHKQVGDLMLNKAGISTKGLLIRHLILPNNLDNSKRVIDFISQLSKNTYFNLMDQYRPAYKSANFPEIQRRITINEFEEMVEYAKSKGLSRLAE